VGGDGKVAYSNLHLDEMAFVLAGAADFGADIPGPDRHRLVVAALFAPVKKGSRLEDTFLPSLKAEVVRYWRAPIQTFIVASGLSVQIANAGPSFRTSTETRISLPRHFSKRLAPERLRMLKEQTVFSSEELPSGYRPLRVEVQARTVHAAIDKGMDCVDLIRSIWNFFFNRQQLWRSSSGVPEPVNRIRLHPIHSVHRADGTLGTDQWWYQPEYRHPARTVDVTAEWAKVSTFTRRVRQYLSHCTYANAVASGLRQYVRALDHADMSTAFSRLWAALELLTATSRLTYDDTVKRASFVFGDSEYMQLVLQNLRRERNRLVHEGAESHAGEVCVYQVKHCVEALLEFHIRNRFRFQTLDEAGAFLSLPRNLSALRQKMRHFRAAKLYQKL
jgi:hypothetical protein